MKKNRLTSHGITSHDILAHMRNRISSYILHLIYYILSHFIPLGGPEHTHPNQLQPLFTTHDPAWNQNDISYQ